MAEMVSIVFPFNGDLSYFVIHWRRHHVRESLPGQNYDIMIFASEILVPMGNIFWHCANSASKIIIFQIYCYSMETKQDWWRSFGGSRIYFNCLILNYIFRY